jgi:hypothetical protein
MSSMTSREQVMATGGGLPIRTASDAIVFFLLVVAAAVGGAVWGGVSYALTH